MDIRPAVINAIGKPSKASGTSATSSCSLIPDISINAIPNPTDAPTALNIV